MIFAQASSVASGGRTTNTRYRKLKLQENEDVRRYHRTTLPVACERTNLRVAEFLSTSLYLDMCMRTVSLNSAAANSGEPAYKRGARLPRANTAATATEWEMTVFGASAGGARVATLSRCKRTHAGHTAENEHMAKCLECDGVREVAEGRESARPRRRFPTGRHFDVLSRNETNVQRKDNSTGRVTHIQCLV